MPIAEFEEKQYETAANIELALQHAAVFAAGQVLESVVGYDAATAPPQNAPIWGLMGTNAPKGLQLTPNLWQPPRVPPKAPDLPSSYVSLILQYKRPRYLQSTLAAQYNYWQGAYYRFLIDQNQQDILAQLESSLSGRAILRYACPAFWKYDDLQIHQQNKSILSQSTFVSASNLVSHTAWTYRSPGTVGYPNPRYKEVSTDNFSTLWKSLETKGKRRKENLFQHLRQLGSALETPLVEERPDDNTWLNQFNTTNQLNPVQSQAVLDTLELTEHFGKTGSSWFVVDLDSLNP